MMSLPDESRMSEDFLPRLNFWNRLPYVVQSVSLILSLFQNFENVQIYAKGFFLLWKRENISDTILKMRRYRKLELNFLGQCLS